MVDPQTRSQVKLPPFWGPVLFVPIASQLAAHANIFVNDAFGAAHRSHASTVGVTKYMDHSVAGFLMEKELDYLKGAMDSPSRPFLAMIGGAKVSTKVSGLRRSAMGVFYRAADLIAFCRPGDVLFSL